MFVFINCLGLNLHLWICFELRTKLLSTAFGLNRHYLMVCCTWKQGARTKVPRFQRAVYLVCTAEKTTLLLEILLTQKGRPASWDCSHLLCWAHSVSRRLLFFPPEFGAKLEKDICGDTSGHYQKLLVILLQVQKIKKKMQLRCF